LFSRKTLRTKTRVKENAEVRQTTTCALVYGALLSVENLTRLT